MSYADLLDDLVADATYLETLDEAIERALNAMRLGAWVNSPNDAWLDQVFHSQAD